MLLPTLLASHAYSSDGHTMPSLPLELNVNVEINSEDPNASYAVRIANHADQLLKRKLPFIKVIKAPFDSDTQRYVLDIDILDANTQNLVQRIELKAPTLSSTLLTPQCGEVNAQGATVCYNMTKKRIKLTHNLMDSQYD